MQPVGKYILLYKLFNSESASYERSQCCISRSGQIDILSHTMQMCRCRIVACRRIERRQVVIRLGDEAHHLRFLCVHRQIFPVGISSEPVEHGLQLVMDIEQQREVVSKQQFWDSKIWSTSKCALYPFSQMSTSFK